MNFIFSSFFNPLKRFRVACSFLWGGEHRLKGDLKRCLKGGFKVDLKGDLRRCTPRFFARMCRHCNAIRGVVRPSRDQRLRAAAGIQEGSLSGPRAA